MLDNRYMKDRTAPLSSKIAEMATSENPSDNL
jgi:hypothetical protein